MASVLRWRTNERACERYEWRNDGTHEPGHNDESLVLQRLLDLLFLLFLGLSAVNTSPSLPPAHLLELPREVLRDVELEVASTPRAVYLNVAGHAVHLILERTKSQHDIYRTRDHSHVMSRTYELHEICEREAVGRLLTTVTFQRLHIEAFLAFEMESVQRTGEQENGVVHERHLGLQHRITELSVRPRPRSYLQTKACPMLTRTVSAVTPSVRL